jgi:hypothetical protein
MEQHKKMSTINLNLLRKLIKEEFDRHNNITDNNKNNPVGYNSDPYNHDNMAVKEPMYMAGAVLAEEIPPTDMPTIDPVKARAEMDQQIRTGQNKIKYLEDQLKAAKEELAKLQSQPSGMPNL